MRRTACDRIVNDLDIDGPVADCSRERLAVGDRPWRSRSTPAAIAMAAAWLMSPVRRCWSAICSIPT